MVYENALIAKIIYTWRNSSEGIDHVAERFGISRIDCWALIMEHYCHKEPAQNTIVLRFESQLNFVEIDEVY